jgi:hypothetical protein
MSAIDSSDEQTPGERMDQRERIVLYMLFHDPFPWAIEELQRELGDRGDVADAVASLAAAGLVRRLGEFVVPTRAARRSDKLYGEAI